MRMLLALSLQQCNWQHDLFEIKASIIHQHSVSPCNNAVALQLEDFMLSAARLSWNVACIKSCRQTVCPWQIVLWGSKTLNGLHLLHHVMPYAPTPPPPFSPPNVYQQSLPASYFPWTSGICYGKLLLWLFWHIDPRCWSADTSVTYICSDSESLIPTALMCSGLTRNPMICMVTVRFLAVRGIGCFKTFFQPVSGPWLDDSKSHKVLFMQLFLGMSMKL